MINLTIGGEYHEIKLISSGPTRYKSSMKQRVVNKLGPRWTKLNQRSVFWSFWTLLFFTIKIDLLLREWNYLLREWNYLLTEQISPLREQNSSLRGSKFSSKDMNEMEMSKHFYEENKIFYRWWISIVREWYCLWREQNSKLIK